jgi:hypothetical protein
MVAKADEIADDVIPSKNYTRFVMPLAGVKAENAQGGAGGKTFMNRMTGNHTLQVMSGGIKKSRELVNEDKPESPSSPVSPEKSRSKSAQQLPGAWPGSKND